MSRIYDALRRASLERKTGQQTEETEVAGEPFALPGDEELPPLKAEVILELIAEQPWNPFMAFLPTLTERGESIEQFRSLRSQIYEFCNQAPLQTILISSGMPAEGKTFVAANLAMSLARNSENNILLIDADLRGPSIHNILGAPNTPGLAEYLAGEAGVNEIMQRNRSSSAAGTVPAHNIPNLTFIPAGAGGDNASELVANHRIEELIATLSPYFDWIVIDSPPVLVFADAIDLARAADAILLVARGASTPYDVAQRAQAAFSNSRILGFVLNAVKNAPRNRSYYYHYYGKQKAGSEQQGRRDNRRQE
jgi:capsular exopolysaccharide synthesis family protein